MEHTVISRKVVGKTVNATIPKGNMGCDQFTVPDTVSIRKHLISMPSSAILSNFFEEQ